MMSNAAITHLKKEPKINGLINQLKLEELDISEDVYANLIRAIVYQQLSGKAAGTIHRRFLLLFSEEYPFPEELLDFEIADLRAVGLSNAKANYVQNVATFFMEHKLRTCDWSQKTDDEILKQLTQIKGVGEWTVQMILMFTLGRGDVLPLGDLAIQQAMQQLFDLDTNTKILKKQMLQYAEPWQPYRTLACRYLWKWKDTK